MSCLLHFRWTFYYNYCWIKISMNAFTQNVKDVKKKRCKCSLEYVLHWKSSVFQNTGTIVRCSTGTHIFKPGSWNISWGFLFFKIFAINFSGPFIRTGQENAKCLIFTCKMERFSKNNEHQGNHALLPKYASVLSTFLINRPHMATRVK